MNRKVGNTAIRFGPALKAVLICLVTCSLGLGYVWQKQQINTLGEQIKKNEIRLEELRSKNKIRMATLASLTSPQKLDERLREFNLGLEVPRPEQIVPIIEQRETRPPKTKSLRKADKEFFTDEKDEKF